MEKIVKFILAISLMIISLNTGYSQPTKSIGITQPVTLSGHVLREMVSGITNIKLKKMPALTTEVTGVEIGSTGFYLFSGLTPGFYKLFINGTEKQEYGVVQIATFLDSLGTVKMGSDFDMNSHKIINLADATTGTDAISRAFGDNRYLVLDNNGNEQTVNDPVVFAEVAKCPNLPVEDYDLTNKAYVDEQIASIVFTPTQFGDDIRRVISSGVNIPGRDYTTIAGALGSISSTNDTTRFKIELLTGSYDPNVNIDNVFYADHNLIQNYTSLIGTGLNTNLILGVNSASVTKTAVNIENCTVYLGANDISGNRTYNGWTFNNCIIYTYRSITLNNCNMKNCDVVTANTYTTTLTGTGKYTGGCTFAQNVTKTSFTGTTPGMVDGYDTNPTMPADPSLSP